MANILQVFEWDLGPQAHLSHTVSQDNVSPHHTMIGTSDSRRIFGSKACVGIFAPTKRSQQVKGKSNTFSVSTPYPLFPADSYEYEYQISNVQRSPSHQMLLCSSHPCTSERTCRLPYSLPSPTVPLFLCVPLATMDSTTQDHTRFLVLYECEYIFCLKSKTAETYECRQGQRTE